MRQHPPSTPNSVRRTRRSGGGDHGYPSRVGSSFPALALSLMFTGESPVRLDVFITRKQRAFPSSAQPWRLGRHLRQGVLCCTPEHVLAQPGRLCSPGCRKAAAAQHRRSPAPARPPRSGGFTTTRAGRKAGQRNSANGAATPVNAEARRRRQKAAADTSEPQGSKAVPV